MMKLATFLLSVALSLLAATLLSSCSDASSGDAATPEVLREELAALNEEKAALQERIDAIEEELRANGDVEETVKLTPVKSVKLRNDTLAHFIEVQGMVESDRNIFVSPKQAGIVTRVFVTEGSRVQAGDVLAQLDDSLLRKQLAELETQFAFAKTMFEKRKRVWESKVGSEMQYLAAKNDMETLERRIASVNEQIDMMKVRAPFAGIVDEVVPKVGEAVQPGPGAFRVVSHSNLKVAVQVSEAYRASIKKGDPVTLHFPDVPNGSYASRVTAISESIDAQNRTFTLYAGIPSNSKSIKPNMICTATLNDVTKEDVIVVPVNTVQRFNNEQYVMLVKSDSEGYKASRVVVQTGLSYRDRIVVTNGLQEGDDLVTVGFQDLADGDLVQPL